MACDGSDVRRDDRAPVPVKILTAGGFGVGKTTLMGALTGIRPLLIEESVAMDFGRIPTSGAWLTASRPPTTSSIAVRRSSWHSIVFPGTPRHGWMRSGKRPIWTPMCRSSRVTRGGEDRAGIRTRTQHNL